MDYNKFIILDGAMGTMLQANGLQTGEIPELWNLSHPDIIPSIQKQYIDAGSNVIYANTFGANRLKLKGASVREVITCGIKAAKAAAEGTGALVALDIGPIGQLLEPLGTLSFDEAYDIFAEMVTAGRDAGADLIVFETLSDLYEAKAGVLAAKENSDLPVWVTMTFEKNARTFLGVTVASMALTLSALGVDALGFNCSLGPKELLPMVKELSEWTDLPIILKPNAGLPDPESGTYTITGEAFAEELSKAVNSHATILGGCCGTNPDFIKAVFELFKGKTPVKRTPRLYNGICSPTKAVDLNKVSVIGERINPTGKKRFQEALKAMDMGYISAQGISQEEAGSDILDVNVGLPEIDEAEVIKKVVTNLQSSVDCPLMIDSSNPQAIEAGLRYYNGKCIVNSVNGNKETLDLILPLCKKYGAAVVGLCMDNRGIPQSAKERIEIAKTILNSALAHGICRDDIIIDCLTLTVSAQQEQAIQTLKAVEYISKEMKLHTTLGVSNISFGLPQRENITASYKTQALLMGLNHTIINPNQSSAMDAVFSFKALHNIDKNCREYIQRFTASTAEQAEPHPTSSKSLSIAESVQKGLKDEVFSITKELLKEKTELEIVNEYLIPALDAVGEKYENHQLFLPQLINAANAACSGFELIRTSLSQKGSAPVSGGKILLATVKGDIHDIGKNIVKVVLENYGYTIFDLGKDVPYSEIIDVVKKENITLVGLSALMTTTVANMEETIHRLKADCPSCKIWVGGAVLTEEYAKKIGADYYAKDAKQSADIAKKVLG